MREIKFRGQTEHEKEWVYGYAILNQYFESLIVPTWKICNSLPQMIHEGKWVCTETVSQFTGLKDRNGVEIYEGDIVEGWKESHWHEGKDKVFEVVEWRDEIAGFNIIGIETSEIEIIGNIYEHPHLLKGE